LLALARTSRDAAHADAYRTSAHLKEVQKAAEVLHVQEAIAFSWLRDARRRVGAVRGALDRLGIPPVLLSDDEDNIDSDMDENPIPTPGLLSDSSRESESIET